jgi:hypothetical protein
MGRNRCTGVTGDTCDFECSGDFLPFGEHKCGVDGFFNGGMCISECHTLQLDGDCFPSYNGIYLIQDNEVRGQPHYVKQDLEPGDKDLHCASHSCYLLICPAAQCCLRLSCACHRDGSLMEHRLHARPMQ